MKDEAKTKKQLIEELGALRERCAELERFAGEQKPTEESIAQLATFPELNPNPIVEVDFAGTIHYLNPAAKELFPDLQILGVQHPWLANWNSVIVKFTREGKVSYVRDIQMDNFWYEQSIHCLAEGRRIRIYGVDITERKRAEEALKNTLQETKQRQAEVSALLEASRAILQYHDFKDSARSIFDSCKNLTRATAGYIALLSKDGTENEVLFLDSGGLPCTVAPNLPMPIRGLRGEAYRDGKAVYDNEFSQSEWMNYMPEGHVRLSNVLFAPLMMGGKVIGLLGIGNKPGGFTENDARMASAFGELAAIALHNSRTLEALESSEERLRSVVTTANDAIISVDSSGKIVFWNNSAETIFGYSADEAIGKPLTLIIPEQFHEAHKKGMDRVVVTGKSKIVGKTVEMLALRKGGNEFPVEFSLATWKTSEGVFFTGIIRDITERKRMEEELRRSRDELEIRVQQRTAELAKINEELQTEIAERGRAEKVLYEQSRMLEAFFKHTITPLVFLDKHFNFIRVNEAYAKACQRHISEFPGHNHFEFYPSDAKAIFEQVVQTKVPYQAVARPFVFPDHPDWGVTYWDWTLTPLLDDKSEVEFLVFSLADVTEPKRAEEALRKSEEQLRHLYSQLLAAQENERKRVAQELHDGLQQFLTGIKFKVEGFIQEMRKSKVKTPTKPLEAVIPIIQESVREIRRIQMNLRPAILDDLGILATISWFSREYETTYPSIHVEKQINIQEDEIPEPLKMVIYRILQEGLTNVAKHSGASLVILSFRKTNGRIELSIQDNGRGFDLQEALSVESPGREWGLASMRERAEHSGGSFGIESAKGKGTFLRAIWPL